MSSVSKSTELDVDGDVKAFESWAWRVGWFTWHEDVIKFSLAADNLGSSHIVMFNAYTHGYHRICGDVIVPFCPLRDPKILRFTIPVNHDYGAASIRTPLSGSV